MAIDEGGALIGAPRPPRNVGPSVRIDRVGKSFCVVSTPYPIHYAWVTQKLAGGWAVVMETADIRAQSFGKKELAQALRYAGRMVGQLYRQDYRRKFTGPQRFVMGRNLCPARIPCPGRSDPTRAVCDNQTDSPEHYHLCKRVPQGPRTIWCAEHTTPELPGEAFGSIADPGTGGD